MMHLCNVSRLDKDMKDAARCGMIGVGRLSTKTHVITGSVEEPLNMGVKGHRQK